MKLAAFQLLVAGTFLWTGCGPAPTSEAGNPAIPHGPSSPKSITIATLIEPTVMGMTMGARSGGTSGLKLAVHQRLASYDDRGDLHPMLAMELPTQASGSWVVRPDGSMLTTYRLHPNVTWHDGTPLTSRDFAFALQVTMDPALPIDSRVVARQISRIDTPDAATLNIEWTATYPFANAITQEDLGPLPAHLLETAYREEKERFPVLRYWNREFVGVGPYTVADWEPGSHLVLKAYDQFYRGRAKIDTLTFRFISDPSTIVANLLAGSVDGFVPRTLNFAQAVFLRDEWQRAGKKPTSLFQPLNWIFVNVQFRNSRPAELQDVRVRRGLVHAIDREALVDVIYQSSGLVGVSDTYLSADEVKWAWVKDVVVKYDYSPRRAQELFAEAGWRPAADGMLVGARGERVTLPLWSFPSGPNEAGHPVLADFWKKAGIEVDGSIIPPARATNQVEIASFPGLYHTGSPLHPYNLTLRWHSSNCPTEETRFAGANVGCAQVPLLDRLIDQLAVAIDLNDQRRLYRDLVKLQTEELPVLPLHFDFETTGFREGVIGVKGESVPRTDMSWNVAEWDVR